MNSIVLYTLYHKDLPTPEVFVNECLHDFGIFQEMEECPKAILQLCEVENELQDLCSYVGCCIKTFLDDSCTGIGTNKKLNTIYSD